MKNIELGYNITIDPNFFDKQNAISPELSSKLERFHDLALEGKKSSVHKILNAIERYPDNPQLKNYLSVLYGKIGDDKKKSETTRRIVAEHPNYLFGKLNLANEYYLKEEFHKMPEILGNAMEIKAMYPERDTFHINEVISFYKCTVLYFTAIDDIKQAENRYAIMHKLAPAADDTEAAKNQILLAKMNILKKRFDEEQKNRISVKAKKQEIKTISKAPKFNHEEIGWLYEDGLYIEEENLNAILSLPKDTLIQDLELVLKDSIDRYGFFYQLEEDNGWDEEKMSFVVHAIFLLGELESTKSIDVIFNVLSQSEEYLEFYLGDFLTASIWEPVYKMANANLQACKQFMFKSGVYTFARTVIPDMVKQIVFHQPKRLDEVLLWFKEVMEFFLHSNLEDNVIDSDVIGLLICNVIEIEGKVLMPEIEMLFEKGFVSEGIGGDWNEVKKAFERPDNLDEKKEILSIKKRYDYITSTWAGYVEEESDIEINYNHDEYLEPPIIPVKAESKIGRNEPCPCGSGKKYKKCCLNK